MSNPNVTRLGDDVVRTSILANILEGAFETTICAAVGVVVVTTAAPLAAAAAAAADVSTATVATASVAVTTYTAAGIVRGLAVSLSGAAEIIGDIAQGAADFISLPSPQRKIAAGSLDVQTDGLPAAKAAGRLMTAAENATREKMETEEETRREEEDTRMFTGMKVLNGVSALFSYSSELLGELINSVVARPSGRVVEAKHGVVLCEKRPSNPIQFMAEGSSQVSINGLPVVHTGDRTTCSGTASTVVSPNVIIGGKLVVVRPTYSDKSSGVEAALLVLSILTCRPTKLLKQFPCMIMGMTAAMLTGKIGESVRTLRNPVHTATGAKVLNRREDYDSELPIRFPLIWQRTYNNCNLHEGLFGRD